MGSVQFKKKKSISAMRNLIGIIFYTFVFISNLCATENGEQGTPFFNSLIPTLDSRHFLIDCQNFCLENSKDIRIDPLKNHHATLPSIVLPNMKPSDLNGKMRKINGEKIDVYERKNPVYDGLKLHHQTKYLQENLNDLVSHFSITNVSNFNGFLVFEINPIFNKNVKQNQKNTIKEYLGTTPHISLFKMGTGRSEKSIGLTQKDQYEFTSPLLAKFNKGELKDIKITFDKINFNVGKESRGTVLLGKRSKSS